jgi:SagB-type dehydrogenase family enzyme
MTHPLRARSIVAALTKLPSPSHRGTRTLEEALVKRRSNRTFLDRPIELAAVGQILWAGQGIRDRSGARTAPSAGGRYPLDLYLVTEAGVGHYMPDEHAIEAKFSADVREALYSAALFQDSIKQAPLVIVITADYARAEHQYGEERAKRFALMESGHVAQNLLLQAYAMGLAGGAFGAFKDEQVSEAMKLPPEQTPLYIIAIGYSRS